MRIFRAIIISSLSIPALIFVMFFGSGLVFLTTMLIQDGEYNKGWLGMVYAGAMYSYFSLFISGIPAIALGWPASLIANRVGRLEKQVVLPGSALLGGIYLSVAGGVFFKPADIQLIFWLFLAGAIGGFVNGAVFLRHLKPNKSLKTQPSAAGTSPTGAALQHSAGGSAP